MTTFLLTPNYFLFPMVASIFTFHFLTNHFIYFNKSFYILQVYDHFSLNSKLFSLSIGGKHFHISLFNKSFHILQVYFKYMTTVL